MLTVVGKSQDRAVIKIVVSPAAKGVIERVAARFGMKEFAVASAIYEWFGEQDDIAQRAILGMLEGLEIDAAARFMERLAQRSEVKDKPPNGTSRIKRRKAVRTEAGELEYQERREP